MADALLVLAQSSPSATTLTDIYTPTAGKTATISTITVCNRGAVRTTFRISVSVAGVADNVKQYLFYDAKVGPNSTFAATIGVTMGLGDVLRVYVGLATVSFNVFGVEVG